MSSCVYFTEGKKIVYARQRYSLRLQHFLSMPKRTLKKAKQFVRILEETNKCKNFGKENRN